MPAPLVACGGACVDLATAPHHCGSCDKACATGLSYVNKVYPCTPLPGCVGTVAGSGTAGYTDGKIIAK